MSSEPQPNAKTMNASNDCDFSDLHSLSPEALAEFKRRVREIDNSYRALAEKMGQLYMRADASDADSLTRSLDKPMRNASDSERMFANLLRELQTAADLRRRQASTPGTALPAAEEWRKTP